MQTAISNDEKRQAECNRRSSELYKRLLSSYDKASYVVSNLNNQKIRIFIAKVKLFVKKLQGKQG